MLTRPFQQACAQPYAAKSQQAFWRWIQTLTLVCACVQIMDTPLPGQIRPIQQEAGRATEVDVMELVEMILGALGRDALGLGSSIAHPRESEEWQSMTPHQKLEFFAPIWRIMRDENMTVEQVSLHIL